MVHLSAGGQPVCATGLHTAPESTPESVAASTPLSVPESAPLSAPASAPLSAAASTPVSAPASLAAPSDAASGSASAVASLVASSLPPSIATASPPVSATASAPVSAEDVGASPPPVSGAENCEASGVASWRPPSPGASLVPSPPALASSGAKVSLSPLPQPFAEANATAAPKSAVTKTREARGTARLMTEHDARVAEPNRIKAPPARAVVNPVSCRSPSSRRSPHARLPEGRARDPRLLEGAAHLREDALAGRRRAARSSSTRARPRPTAAAQRARPHARHQGRLPPLQDDARLPRAPQGRLGHARAAGRGGGREGAPHPRQGGHRAVRRRAVHPQVHRVGLPVHERVGGADRARRLLGATSTTPTSPTTALRRERVVGALASCYKKGLLYQGHKVVWWWAQGGTALSLGARWGRGTRRSTTRACTSRSRWSARQDTVAPRVDDDAVDLPSNMYAAVHPDVDYVVVARPKDGRASSLAKALVEALAKKLGASSTVEREMKGAELVGKAYRPPFDLLRAAKRAASRTSSGACIAADFVTLDAGTASSTSPPPSARTTTTPTARSLRDRPGPAALLRREARRHVHRRASSATRAAGSRTATRRSSTT